MIEQYNFVDSTLPMKCSLCGRKTEKIMKIIDGVRIYECKNCRLGFVDQKKIVKKSLKKLYRLKEYRKEEKMIVSRLNPIVGNIIRYKSSGSALEIGSGHGLLSSLLLKKGNYELDVVEPYLTPHYLEGAIYDLHRTDLDRFLKINKKKYELIMMFDVIEHLKDPFTSLRKLKSILSKDGIFVIQTPNYQSLMQSMSKNWSWWMIEDHKWFFTISSLQKVLSQSGLSIVYEQTYEDWIDFKRNLDGNFLGLKNSVIRKTAKAIFFIIFTPFYFLTRHIFWRGGRGGLLLVIACLDGINHRDYHQKKKKNKQYP